MKVLYHDIVPAPEEVELRCNARRVEMRSLLERIGIRDVARATRLEHTRADQPRNAAALCVPMRS